MEKIKTYSKLHFLMAIFSLSPVCAKLAGQYDFLSWKFVLFYGISLFILALYALGWQQVIKGMPLTTAYANKAVSVVWGLLWGLLFFSEKITVQKTIGAVVIILGIVFYSMPSEAGKNSSVIEGDINE